MEERPDSAMGPSDEPGEAKPAPADKSRGLGGLGTEGKIGNPAGGVEPQLPVDLATPSPPEISRVVQDIEKMPPEAGSPVAEGKSGDEDEPSTE